MEFNIKQKNDEKFQLAGLLAYGRNCLADVGIAESELDARLLLEAATGKGRTEIYMGGAEHVAKDAQKQFLQYIERRSQREPVAYILGEQEFWSLPFAVSSDVLIPRPETEFLLEKVFALTREENYSQGAILDLCCGSGVISVVLAKEHKKAVTALDISEAALSVTKQNAEKNNVAQLVTIVHSDLFSALAPENHQFSLVVSNPPYVSTFDIEQNLDPEVAEYEPRLALDGGRDGLELIARIEEALHDFLLPGGQFFMEFGAEQGGAVLDLFGLDFWELTEIFKDYAGRDRVLHAMRKKI